jgi:hypothetical protein
MSMHLINIYYVLKFEVESHCNSKVIDEKVSDRINMSGIVEGGSRGFPCKKIF